MLFWAHLIKASLCTNLWVQSESDMFHPFPSFLQVLNGLTVSSMLDSYYVFKFNIPRTALVVRQSYCTSEETFRSREVINLIHRFIFYYYFLFIFVNQRLETHSRFLLSQNHRGCGKRRRRRLWLAPCRSILGKAGSLWHRFLLKSPCTVCQTPVYGLFAYDK